LLPLSANGAAYIPVSDGELARDAPIIILGEVVDETVRWVEDASGCLKCKG
jgi:hypothetical protein